MKKFGIAMLAVAGLAAAANAQSYTIETRWVAETTTGAQGGVGTQQATGAADNGSGFTVDAPYRQRYALQARVVMTGQTNYGLLAIHGDISAGGMAIIDNHVGGVNAFTGAGRANPFTFNTDTATTDGQARTALINGFTASQNAFPTVTWNNGEAKPAAPVAQGVDPNWATVYRVYVEITANDLLTAGTKTVTFNAAQLEPGTAINGWTQVPQDLTPPDDFNPSVQFNYAPLVAQGLQSVGSSSFKLNLVPAPASAALLGLGGLVAARRRRA